MGLSAAVLLALLGLALLRPARPIFPCGFHALSGLPCLFCGGTRAVRAILHGDLQAAIYLNPLAFPALALVVATVVVLLIEAAAARSLVPWEDFVRRFGRIAPVLVLPALGFWVIHIYLALRTPKPELVDFHNPIAAAVGEMVQPIHRQP